MAFSDITSHCTSRQHQLIRRKEVKFFRFDLRDPRLSEIEISIYNLVNNLCHKFSYLYSFDFWTKIKPIIRWRPMGFLCEKTRWRLPNHARTKNLSHCKETKVSLVIFKYIQVYFKVYLAHYYFPKNCHADLNKIIVSTILSNWAFPKSSKSAQKVKR